MSSHPTAVGGTSSVEYVKEHVANELQKTDLDPAMLMGFPAKMMSSSEDVVGKSLPVSCLCCY